MAATPVAPRPIMLLSACLGTLAAGATPAQGPSADASVLTYRTVPVAAGVYAFITPEERSGFQAGNSIVVIGETGVLVFDTGNIPGATRRQIAEIRRLTPLPVRYVVNSHWHPDHNLGNSEYRKAFPGVVVIGSTATRTGIQERMAGYFDEMKRYTKSDSLMRLRLRTGKMRDGSDMPAETRALWTLNTRDFGEFYPEVLTAVPSAPDLVFDDSLTISLGKRRVQLFAPGRGNTQGDVFAVIPDVATLLTGDLVTVPCPFPSTSYFSSWIATLDRLRAIKAKWIVPGHGEVQSDYAYVDLTRRLLDFTRSEARAAVRAGIPLDTLRAKIDFSPFARELTQGDQVRTWSFEGFYVGPALERAYEEAKYESEGPIRP